MRQEGNRLQADDCQLWISPKQSWALECLLFRGLKGWQMCECFLSDLLWNLRGNSDSDYWCWKTARASICFLSLEQIANYEEKVYPGHSYGFSGHGLWSCYFGPVERQHTTAGVNGGTKVLVSQPGGEDRRRKSPGSPISSGTQRPSSRANLLDLSLCHKGTFLVTKPACTEAFGGI